MQNHAMKTSRTPQSSTQQGVTLIVVLILLVVVTVLGIGGARIALLGERSTRYDRDSQLAWQAAEAALIDAEYDIGGVVGGTQPAARPGSLGGTRNPCAQQQYRGAVAAGE